MATDHIAATKESKTKSELSGQAPAVHTSLFRHIFSSDMPPSELSIERLTKEAEVLLGAGTVSTGRTLDFISYYILADRNIRKRLEEELNEAMADYPRVLPKLVDLEKLDYLKAIIKEGLRLSYGVMHRLPRCSPDHAIQYKEWTIPRGTAIGMSSYLMHTDPTVFAKPYEFIPDRWLGEVPAQMAQSLVPFSRGSRQCLGMNLAMVELYIVLAVLYRPGGLKLELFETQESDVTPAHDFLIPLPRLKSTGIKVVLHEGDDRESKCN
ncbi:MAG: hypothetical protein LQ339_002317 [Xanthoria mediterranea]|nr:MAG: hypothetical protein LQ339_002317 [Xanthoria mediterranea]